MTVTLGAGGSQVGLHSRGRARAPDAGRRWCYRQALRVDEMSLDKARTDSGRESSPSPCSGITVAEREMCYTARIVVVAAAVAGMEMVPGMDRWVYSCSAVLESMEVVLEVWWRRSHTEVLGPLSLRLRRPADLRFEDAVQGQHTPCLEN
jgi:hypothetical protein